MEVQERVMPRLPLLMPAPSELERAGDPEIACVEADDLATGVKDPPVARPRTPERDRLDVPSWCCTITGRRLRTERLRGRRACPGVHFATHLRSRSSLVRAQYGPSAGALGP